MMNGIGQWFRGSIFFILATFSVGIGPAASAEPPSPASALFGRYTGVLGNTKLGKEQLARLEFVTAEEGGFLTRLMAVLTLHFGDFTTGEYVTYHFDNVRFNALTSQLVFDEPDQPITLTTTSFGNGEFVGNLRSSTSGDVGILRLKKGDVAEPKLPLIPKIWGFYHGSCNFGFQNGESYLQLVTTRTSADVSPLGNPFGSYTIVGDVAWRSPICLDQWCTVGKITQGSYNFFTGDLRLLGYPNFVCSVEPDGLLCNKTCRYKRVVEGAPPAPVLKFPSSKSELASPSAPSEVTTSIAGEYVGYLHHEYLDTYQVGSLNIASYLVPSPTNPTVSEFHMSAVAALYFGDRTSPELITYQFAERKYPNPVVAPVFVFSRPEAHVDAILQVKEIGHGVVRGDWYSLLFGRVGTFEFRKEGMPELPAAAKRMQPLTGEYESETFYLRLVAANLGVVPPHPYNPFLPMNFGGVLQNEVIPPKVITGGGYDFYTGKINFELGGTVLAGRRVGTKLQLRRFTPSVAPGFLGGDTLDNFVYRGTGTN